MARSVSGSARVVSSVTYITLSPSRTANVIASSVHLQQPVERPALRVLPDRRRSDERAALDRHAGALHDLDDRRDVGDVRPGRAIRGDAQMRRADLAGQRLDVADDVRAGARQADVGGVDAERVDQMQDADLLVDARRAHGRRLQAVAQRLVVQRHGGGRRRRADAVPVVDQALRHHARNQRRISSEGADGADTRRHDAFARGRREPKTMTAVPAAATSAAQPVALSAAPCTRGVNA